MWSDHSVPAISVHCSVTVTTTTLHILSHFEKLNVQQPSFACFTDISTQITKIQDIQETSTLISCRFQYSETNSYIKHDSTLKIKTSYVKVLVHQKIHWKCCSKAQVTVEERKYTFLTTQLNEKITNSKSDNHFTVLEKMSKLVLTLH